MIKAPHLYVLLPAPAAGSILPERRTQPEAFTFRPSFYRAGGFRSAPSTDSGSRGGWCARDYIIGGEISCHTPSPCRTSIETRGHLAQKIRAAK